MTTLSDRIHETTEVTGTGSATLLGAVVRKRPFSTLADNTQVPYVIEGRDASTEWEEGYGTKSGTTLTRTTVLFSSNNNALVNFSAGVKDVYVTVPAVQLPRTNSGNSIAIGPATTQLATSQSIAIGAGALTSNSGISIGVASTAGVGGVAIGASANGTDEGLAIGSLAKGYMQGVALGDYADGYSYSVAVGRYAKAFSNGIAVGYSSNTNNKDAAVALGYYSKAERYREMVKSADRSTPSLRSWSMVDWYGDTTNNTPTEILLGGTASQRCVLLNNSAIQFSCQVIASITGGGDTASWTITGTIKRGATAASTTLVGTPTVTSTGADAGASGWAVSASADTTNGSLNITVTGAAAATVRWNVTTTLSEVRF